MGHPFDIPKNYLCFDWLVNGKFGQVPDLTRPNLELLRKMKFQNVLSRKLAKTRIGLIEDDAFLLSRR